MNREMAKKTLTMNKMFSMLFLGVYNKKKIVLTFFADFKQYGFIWSLLYTLLYIMYCYVHCANFGPYENSKSSFINIFLI